MKPANVLDLNKEAIREMVVRHRAANARVFGSVLHGDDTDESDIDILVDALPSGSRCAAGKPLPGTTLFDLGGLHSDLEELLGVKVDLLTPKELPERFSGDVLAEARPI